MTMTHRGSFTEEHSAQTVIDALGARTPTHDYARLMTALIRHLHDFVKEVQLTEDEWQAGIDFLTRTGRTCSEVRQEFILLSDVLGVSMLVETINHRALRHATEQTVLGPFHMVESPQRELGYTIALDGAGEPCLVTGRVTNADGQPAGRGDRRRMAGQLRGLLRRPTARRPAGTQSAGAVQRRRRRSVLVPQHRAAVLPDPRRRASR